MTTTVGEYLDVGRRCASSLDRVVGESLRGDGGPARVLDFGCGLGRTLRWWDRREDWQVSGCDVDPNQIEWTRAAFPDLEIRLSQPAPPLPWPAGSFDVVVAVSVFSHFDEHEQRMWAEEIARVLAPDGILLASTMGPHALGAFPALATDENLARLDAEGFLYVGDHGSPFNSRGAFHLRQGLERLLGASLRLEWWREGGLDGFQDLSLLRSRS